MIASEADLATLSEAIAPIELSGEQQNQLQDVWIRASQDERKAIARIYSKYFVNASFVQRLQMKISSQRSKDNAGSSRTYQTSGGTGRGRGGKSKPARGGKPADADSQVHHRELRNAIENAVSKLSGDGPFPMEFGVNHNSELNQAVIDVYSTQFKDPDPPELNRIITVPRRLSTRTRTKYTGSYSWFLASLSTNEVACVVTVTVHKVESMVFLEMPLFATAAGYKRHGMGRLLNAALQEHCCRIGGAFIVVSADQRAVPFWMNPSLGYQEMPPRIWSRLEFYYTHECRKFQGTSLLIWEPPADGSVPPLVEEALGKMPKFVINGPLQLPMP